MPKPCCSWKRTAILPLSRKRRSRWLRLRAVTVPPPCRSRKLRRKPPDWPPPDGWHDRDFRVRRKRYYFYGRSSAFDFVAITSQWQSASDEDWALALAREAVIRPLTDQPEVTEGLVVSARAELGISRSLVYRPVAKFRKRPQVSSLLASKQGRKASARTLSVAAEAVVRD